MNEDKIKMIRQLTVGQARETFSQDYGSYDKEDDTYIELELPHSCDFSHELGGL